MTPLRIAFIAQRKPSLAGWRVVISRWCETRMRGVRAARRVPRCTSPMQLRMHLGMVVDKARRARFTLCVRGVDAARSTPRGSRRAELSVQREVWNG